MLCSFASIGLATAGWAQPAAANDAVKLEKFVVTGSNIPMAADAVAVPVTILSSREIERTGINTNLLEVIRKQLPFFAGNGNLGNSNANTGANSTMGGSQVSLRNLDTLVLINGRRVSNNGANGRGGRSFVDVNQFPVSSIESIEVLTDGASAIYGSDAVGGVVNIKLKQNFNGAEAGARYAVADADYHERSGYTTIGVSRGPVRATVSLSYSQTQPLFQKDRPFSEVIRGRTSTLSGALFPSPAIVVNGANVTSLFLNPAINSPRDRNPVGTAATAASLNDLVANGTYQVMSTVDIGNTLDLAPYVTLMVKQDQRTGTGTFSADLLEKGRLEFFGDFMVAETDSNSQLAAQPTTPNLSIPANAPFNPTRVALGGASGLAAFRYLPRPRMFFNDSELKRLTGGLRGKIGEKFNWEAAYVINDTTTVQRVHNVIYRPNIDRAIAGGFNAQGVPTVGGAFSRVVTGFSESSGTFAFTPALDAMARPGGVDPASLTHVFGTSQSDMSSKLSASDAKISGAVFELPAGEVGMAVGIDTKKERLSGTPDANSRLTGPGSQLWLGATFFDPFSRSRDVDAAFAEVRIPVASPKNGIPGLRALDLTAAYRWEDYSDVGESKVPKYGVRWQPFDDQLTLRYTYSESFTAPTMHILYGPVTGGFVNASTMTTIFGPGFNQAQQRSGSNPRLKPSTAETNSWGFVVSPKAVKGLSVSVNYVEIDQVDVIASVGVPTILQSVEQLGAQSPYASQVTLENFVGEAGAQPVTAAGQLGAFLRAGNQGNRIFVFDGAVNLAGQRVKALDVAVDYALPTEAGKFEFSTTGTFFLDYQYQALPSQPYYEYAGHATNAGTGSQGTLPGYRFYTAVTWSKGPWSALLGNTYIPSIVDIGTGGHAFATSTVARRVSLPSYSVFDAQVGYTFRGGKGAWTGWFNGLRVTAGVNNIANKFGPISPAFNGESNVDIATYSPIGRVWFVSANIKF